MKRLVALIGSAIALLSSTSGMAMEEKENIAKYRVVTHSSIIDANQCGHLVVDGCSSSYWEASARDKDQWLLIDLAQQAEASSIEIEWGENYARSYSISAGCDSPSATIFQTQQGVGGRQTIELDGSAIRFVRIQIETSVESIRGCTIREVAVFGAPSGRFQPSEVHHLGNDLSLDGQIWRVQSAAFVEDTPQAICEPDFDDQQWIPATVPGTILGDYYNFGALPDPLYGENMHQISDSFFSGNDFWYRTNITIPEDYDSQRLYINFSGINYNSQIFFNGEPLGTIEGAFQRGEFEITDLLRSGEANTVAVKVLHNHNWVSGSFKVIKKSLGAATTNGDMLGLDGPTSLASAGWNWLPIIKGRNNGIWNSVSLAARSSVSIIDPWVVTDLILPDTTQANLTINTEIKNSSSHPVSGTLRASFDGSVIEQPISLEAGESREVSLEHHNFEELSIKNPKLWWPNGYGEPNLTPLTLEFMIDGESSDTKTLNFGIRELEYKIENEILFIYCNGHRVQLKGGNWGLPEAMMRLDLDDYLLRVMLHADANFNMIRNWIGMTNREEFYEACDRYGILVFDDFWLANPANGPAASDLELFMANAIDKIKWTRKHPSLALYCGRNEGVPPLNFDTAMRKACEEFDGSRYYVSNSADKPLSGFGPYDVREPEWYFTSRGKTFHSEIGIIAIPEVESMRKMMPEENLWPINNMWAIRDYQAPRSFRYTTMLDERYGESSSIEEYCQKAQLQNFETSKALFECLQSNQGSGMLLWMSQSAWPSLICQLYDHFLEYTSAYFAVKRSCSPIHTLFDSARGEIRVANNTLKPIEGAQVAATIYDRSGTIVWQKRSEASIPNATTEVIFPMDHPAQSEVQFLRLEVTKGGEVIAENFYWLENSNGDCLDLNDLAACDVSMKIKDRSEGERYTAQVTLKNCSKQISLLNKLKVKDKASHESILPVIYDDNYISLLPGESRTITLSIERRLLEGREAEITLEGWNVAKQKK